jgi:hypothetical protein
MSFQRVFYISGCCCKVSLSDIDKIDFYAWHLSTCGENVYLRSTVRLPGDKFKTVYMHRLIMDCPEGKEVDHINGDTLDNRRENLRIVDKEENVRLMHARRADDR